MSDLRNLKIMLKKINEPYIIKVNPKTSDVRITSIMTMKNHDITISFDNKGNILHFK